LEPTIETAFVKRSLDWIKKKFEYHLLSDRAKSRNVKRGQIYYCDFGENIGSEQCKKRPALIIQTDTLNRSGSTVIVAPITSQIKAGNANYTLNRPTGSQIKGTVLLTNLRTVSKSRLGDFVEVLTTSEIMDIEKSLYSCLGMFNQYKELQSLKARSALLNNQVKGMIQQRNQAQDDLSALKEKLGFQPEEPLETIFAYIDRLQR
jgi:mRNA interferase MazF